MNDKVVHYGEVLLAITWKLVVSAAWAVATFFGCAAIGMGLGFCLGFLTAIPGAAFMPRGGFIAAMTGSWLPFGILFGALGAGVAVFACGIAGLLPGTRLLRAPR